MKLVGSLPRGYVFHAHGLDLGDRPAKFGVRGSLKAWKKFVVRVAKDQPLVIFLLCVAFASMILHLLKVQPFVILLHGNSSIGKSMLAKFVGSVAGGDPTSPETGFAESFKATDVGLEKLFIAHNNLIFILNEFSRVQGSTRTRVDILESTVNDLCAGIPKTRGTDRKGALRYSTCGIVTSNKSYAELLAEAQREPAEAMGPRLIELCAELDPKLGIFGQMPQGFDSSTQAIKAMREAADQNYGWPARSFARRISEHTARRSDTVTRIIAKWER